ncbi:hypothetical protein [Catelliglobosispora koreensis]|uniref:hypothetical protein n=1 Tax=Catelliglobosispora koreensis TaxID=129052 RepID=UPI000377ECF1|nr:hypothetical protein [Catelliglobosispora koreensis]
MKKLVLLGLGALAAQAALKAIGTPKDLERTNFRGSTVSLAGGPALAVSASLTAGSVAGAVAGLGSGAVGFYDDIVGSRPEEKAYKGFKGHLRGLQEGRVTSGLVKIAGVGLSALAASALLSASGRPASARPASGQSARVNGSADGESHFGKSGRKRALEIALGAGVIAGSANLLNLLDLRPGRALKTGLLAAGALGQPGPAGAAGALLPQDLDEEIMLGDTGANALGAVLGVAVAQKTGLLGRAAVLAGLTVLTLASEKVSFTKVIEKTPVLREADAWGRRSAK